MAVGPATPRRSGRVDSADTFTTYLGLDDQIGIGGVLNFVFTSAVDVVFVYTTIAAVRAAPDASTPTSSKGVFCAIGAVTPIPYHVNANGTVKVYAPNGANVSVWGMGY